MESIESVIGYHFENPALRQEALTHASLARQRGGRLGSNQRLEFLGDSVLQLVLTDHLFHLLPKVSEGVLTKMRADLVSTTALARVARSLDLGRFLEMDPGEEANGGRQRESILADGLEAVLGAIYLDGGLEPSRELILKLFRSSIEEVKDGKGREDSNPKGRLQEVLQGLNQETPVYELLDSSGPDHAREFSAVVKWTGRELGRGTGRSKKEAEAEAAKDALARSQFGL